METSAFLYNSSKIVYRTQGSGPLVVLLHGFGEDGTVWANQFDCFPGHRLVVPDLPGSGGSAAIADMSMEGLADAVQALLSSLDAEPSIVIGHSMGGYVTLALAERYPESVKAFGLFHSTAFADSEEKKEGRRRGIDFIRQHRAFPFLKAAVPNLFAPDTKETKPHLVEEQIEAVRNFQGEALVSYYEAMIQRPDRTAVLQRSAVPVLFVIGRYDGAVPLADSLKQCHLPHLSYIHLLQHSGHMGMVEEPGEANIALKRFIKTTNETT